MAAASFFLVAALGAWWLASSVAAYVTSSGGGQGLAPDPQPQLLIHFPKTTEIGCFLGEQPPAGSRGVFFQLDRLLGSNHTCKFLTYNMRDYRGTNDAYRFRRLISMYPYIVRRDRKLECDRSTGDVKEPQGDEFEILRGGARRLCRMVEDTSARSDVGRLELLEGYKRLPGGVLLLRAWYDLPAASRSRGGPRGRYSRSPQRSGAQEAARRHDSAAEAAARIQA